MTCPPPPDMTKCDQKCKCSTGPCANQVFPCADPCAGNGTFNRSTCECDPDDCGICGENSLVKQRVAGAAKKYESQTYWAIDQSFEGDGSNIVYYFTTEWGAQAQYSWRADPSPITPGAGYFSMTNTRVSNDWIFEAVGFDPNNVSCFQYDENQTCDLSANNLCNEPYVGVNSTEEFFYNEPVLVTACPNRWENIDCCSCSTPVNPVTPLQTCPCPEGTWCYAENGYCYEQEPTCEF